MGAKFIIEVEEGKTVCRQCPFSVIAEDGLLYCGSSSDCLNCDKYDLSTMNISKLE